MASVSAVLRSLYEEMQEYNYDRAAVAEWRLGPDEYYDFLSSWDIGHRRLRKWVNEKKAGETVTLTKAGVALFQNPCGFDSL